MVIGRRYSLKYELQNSNRIGISDIALLWAKRRYRFWFDLSIFYSYEILYYSSKFWKDFLISLIISSNLLFYGNELFDSLWLNNKIRNNNNGNGNKVGKVRNNDNKIRKNDNNDNINKINRDNSDNDDKIKL